MSGSWDDRELTATPKLHRLVSLPLSKGKGEIRSPREPVPLFSQAKCFFLFLAEGMEGGGEKKDTLGRTQPVSAVYRVTLGCLSFFR